MCTSACLEFARRHLGRADVEGRTVLEVGAADVNGSVRNVVGALNPGSYVGVDIEDGPGVDEICDVVELVERYGSARFDVVIATEVLEHVRSWRSAISNLKRSLKSGGVLLVTTRSRPFYYHAFPHDYWRYEMDDMRVLFADMEIEALERDPIPGVLLRARKPAAFVESDLSDHTLYSMVRWRRCRDVSDFDVTLFRVLTGPVQRFFARMGRSIRKRLVRS